MSKTLAEWLGQISPYATIVLAGMVSYFMARYQLNRPQRSGVLEKQYENVLAPIHRILFFDSGDSKEDKQTEIVKILSEHYYVVPRTIHECWHDDRDKQFPAAIDVAYKRAQYKLGYSQIKIRKRDLPKELPSQKAIELFSDRFKYIQWIGIAVGVTSAIIAIYQFIVGLIFK